MAAHSKPNLKSFRASGTISKGYAVKFGSTNQIVAQSEAATDKHIGIAQGDAADGEMVEVALPGGGGLAKAQTTVALGKLLTAHTDGKIKPIAAANNRLCAVAMDDAVADDLFAVEIVMGQATATES
jgi:hypothetical protein